MQNKYKNHSERYRDYIRYPQEKFIRERERVTNRVYFILGFTAIALAIAIFLAVTGR